MSRRGRRRQHARENTVVIDHWFRGGGEEWSEDREAVQHGDGDRGTAGAYRDLYAREQTTIPRYNGSSPPLLRPLRTGTNQNTAGPPFPLKDLYAREQTRIERDLLPLYTPSASEELVVLKAYLHFTTSAMET